jgi:sec-independent protein translocase protein TatA
MGLEGFRLGSLLIVLLIIILLFGSKRIRHIGEDIGNAVRSFRKAVQEEPQEKTDHNESQ